MRANRSVHRAPHPVGDDLSYRPETYWPDDSFRLAILGNVQGESRRRLILEALETGTPELPPEGLLQPVLEPSLRSLLGSFHPLLMGGEYLPPYLPGEVEIARVALKSTTGDVISLRAVRQGDGTIHYRIVDEYGDSYEESPFSLAIESSERPLTLGEMIRELEESMVEEYSNIALCHLIRNVEDGAEVDRMRDFITVSSNFYPTLGEIFERKCLAYLESVKPEEDEDDE